MRRHHLDFRPRPARIARPARALAAALALSLAGCGDDPVSPASQTEAPLAAATTALVFAQVSAGAHTTCGVTTDHRAWCWGEAPLGNGSGDGLLSTRPKLVAGGLQWQSVNVGSSFACGLTLARKAYCWGLNGSGQLGDGTRTPRLAPVPVAGGRQFRQLRAGLNHTCAVTPAEVAFCWGDNQFGQLGDGTTTRRTRPVRVTGGLAFSQVRAGGYFSCGQTTTGRAFCWGRNDQGQLGDGTKAERHTPTAVLGGLTFTQVVPGGAHACGVAADRRLWCWGRNEHFELGDGTQVERLAPQLVSSGAVRFTGVTLGVFHSCALATDDRAYCWGDNAVGSLGDGGFGTHTTPNLVIGTRRFEAISAGVVGRHTCGVTAAGTAFCWGLNGSGQLGDGTQTHRPRPTAVVGPA